MGNPQIIRRRWVLARRPQGKGLASGDVEIVESPLQDPRPGEVRVRVVHVSIDPAIRLWISENPPVVAPVPIGQVVPAMGVGVVEASRDEALPVGTLVHGFLGWQSHLVCSGGDLTPLPPAPSLPLTAHLGLLGATGLTAYFGLLELAEPQPEETLVVSAAAGAVGSLVAQIGRIRGCRVIGIAGGPDKCAHLVDELGCNGAIDYKGENVAQRLSVLCPDGVDIYFDNVGGEIHDAVVPQLREFGRVIYCGEISSGYDGSKVTGRVSSLEAVVKALRLIGLRVDLYYHRAGEAIPWLVYWALSGQLKYRVHVLDGLEQAPEALNMVFSGTNRGKMVVQVSPEPEAATG